MRNLSLALAVLLLAGCARDIQNKEAVRQAVVDYLKARQAQTGLDINMMQVEVGTVDFRGTEAHVTVLFRPKVGDGGMSMPYTLDRKGDHWVVRGRQENGANPHGSAGLPALLPPNPSKLPPGHPPLEKKP